MKQLGCALLLVLISVPISGQVNKPNVAPDKPLSNDDVLSMVGVGVGENTVIAAIEHAPTESLDTATDAIGQLTKRGVSKAVIDAMVKRTTQRGKTTAASQAPAQAPEKTRPKVLVAGVGTAPDLQIVLDGLTDFLVGRQIPAKQLGGEPTSRSGYLERAASASGESLLYITLDVGPFQNKHSLKTQCFEPQGKLLWEEEVKSLNLTGSSNPDSLLKKLEKALEPRIGKPGLPVADAAPK